MKRRDAIRKIADAAKRADVDWSPLRDMGSHQIWSLGGQRVSVPRHRELAEGTAEAIFKALEEKLGKDWWRR